MGLKQAPAQNVLPLPARDNDSASLQEKNCPNKSQPSGTVTNLEDWKQTKMAKAPNGNKKDQKAITGRKAPQEMDEKDMLMRVMEIFSNSEIPEGKRREMIEAMEKILSESGEG
jgi:hypothetical protein